MMLSKFRRYIIVARNAMGIAKILTEVWEFIRKYQYQTLDVYQRLVIIAEKRGITPPKPMVNMEKEE